MLRWGILSTANIGIEQVIPAILNSDNGVVFAIASRDEEKAEQVAKRFGVEHWFGSTMPCLRAMKLMRSISRFQPRSMWSGRSKQPMPESMSCARNQFHFMLMKSMRS